VQSTRNATISTTIPQYTLLWETEALVIEANKAQIEHQLSRNMILDFKSKVQMKLF
jgi:hypothetical protein